MNRLHSLIAGSLLLSSAAFAQAPAAPAAAPAPAAAAPSAPVAAPAAAPAAKSWTQKWEELYTKRDEPGVADEMVTLAKTATEANDKDYEAWWRLALTYCWKSNGLEDGDAKADLGKQCWDAGEKAVSINPDDVKGQYWSTVGMGLYSEGLGIFSALKQGIEGKFKNRVKLAIKLDNNYLDGGPTMLFGRFYWKLPWPKRDTDESIKLLSDVLAAHPNNLRAKYFLADSLDSDGKHDEAKRFIQDVLDAPLGVDKPDDRRNKEFAKKWLAAHK